MFVDEAGRHTNEGRRYGWSLGKWKCVLRGSKYGRRLTMIGAMGYDGPLALRMVDGGMSKVEFIVWVKEELAPKLREGDVVVMDNLHSHKSPAAVQAIEAVGATVEYIPPYSPEFNAIEPVWSWLKAAVSKAGPRTIDRLRAAIRKVWDTLTPELCRAFIAHCGYPMPPPVEAPS